MDVNGNVWHHANPFSHIPEAAGTPYVFGNGMDGFDGGSSGGDGRERSASSEGEGFSFSGKYAQQIFTGIQNAYNHPDLGGNWQISIGQNNKGQFGFWGALEAGSGTQFSIWG